MNRRIPNGTYGGVRGRGLAAPSYSIDTTSYVDIKSGGREMNTSGTRIAKVPES